MSDKVKSEGLGLFGVMGVVFIILKLVGVINWSWWLVTLPFWGGFALIISVMIIIGIIMWICNKI